jgi:mRNA interferase MazF
MARKRQYVPERGDFVWLDLRPPRGHQQTGHRPALVLTPKLYNRKTGLCIICPATRHAKGYPFEVINPHASDDASVILADHVRCVDWRARRAQLIHTVADDVLDEVVARLEALLIDP